MKDKSNYPLAVLEAIQPWLNKNDNIFIKEEPSDQYIVSYRSVEYPEFFLV